MKVEVNEIKKEEEKKYPYIGVLKYTGLIVLFVEERCGTVLHPGTSLYAGTPGDKLGEYLRSVWKEENFKKFEGSITLSNEWKIMNQPIKFRAWDKQTKEMHYDFEFILSGTDENNWIVFTSDKQTLLNNPHPFRNPYFFPQFEIMQLTGLLDKNGKEIFAGDILKLDCWNSELYIVENLLDFGYQYYEYILSENHMEILGNIFEHPELLKQSADAD